MLELVVVTVLMVVVLALVMLVVVPVVVYVVKDVLVALVVSVRLLVPSARDRGSCPVFLGPGVIAVLDTAANAFSKARSCPVVILKQAM